MINEYNHDLYKTDWRWFENGYEVTRTSVWTGPGCHNGCGVLTYVKDGKLEKIEGDPNFGYNQGRLCLRCLDMVEAIYNNDRLEMASSPRRRKGREQVEAHHLGRSVRLVGRYVQEDLQDDSRRLQRYRARGIVALSGTGRNAMWHGAMCCVRFSAARTCRSASSLPTPAISLV